MKILILVASCAATPYNALFKAQLSTWDRWAAEWEDCVETRYYWCTDLPSMATHFHVALDRALSDDAGAFNFAFDFIFRTNSSSYVDKARLLEHASTLPRERCYQGVDGDGFASGSGFFISRDVAELLHDDLLPIAREHPELIEDQAVGRCLSRHGVGVTPGAARADFWLLDFQRQFYGAAIDEQIRSAYHVRCKCDSDRARDVEAMKIVHAIKIAGRPGR